MQLRVPAPCPGCELDVGALTHHEIVARLRVMPRRYRLALTRVQPGENAEAMIRQRPRPDVWSALEYAAHAGDMLDIMSPAIQLMEVDDEPKVFFFDPEEQAEEMEYNNWSTMEVITRLETAGADLSAVIEWVNADQWDRTGIFPWGTQTIRASAEQMVHEAHHHLEDIVAGLDALRKAQNPYAGGLGDGGSDDEPDSSAPG